MAQNNDSAGMMKPKEVMWNLFFEYSQTSSIAGFHYIFEPRLSVVGRILWTFMIVLLTMLGAYLSIQNYEQVHLGSVIRLTG